MVLLEFIVWQDIIPHITQFLSIFCVVVSNSKILLYFPVLPPSPADSDSGVSSDLESTSDDKMRLQGKHVGL